jgi:hypothetical protein
MIISGLTFIMSVQNHRQGDCILSLTRLLICFCQLRNFSVLNLESEVIDFLTQYCHVILKTCWDSISKVNAGVADVLMQSSQSVSQCDASYHSTIACTPV